MDQRRMGIIAGMALSLAVAFGWFVQTRFALAQGPGPTLVQPRLQRDDDFRDRDPTGNRDRDRDPRDRDPRGPGRGPRVPGGEIYSGESMLVLISRDRSTVWAYSKYHGIWKRLPLPAPLPPNAIPVVSDLLVVVQMGPDVHAFSGRTGNWDRTRLEAQGEVSVQEDWAYVVGGSRIHAFSAHTGKWESIDPSSK